MAELQRSLKRLQSQQWLPSVFILRLEGGLAALREEAG
jgi:hypothetical protein